MVLSQNTALAKMYAQKKCFFFVFILNQPFTRRKCLFLRSPTDGAKTFSVRQSSLAFSLFPLNSLPGGGPYKHYYDCYYIWDCISSAVAVLSYLCALVTYFTILSCIVHSGPALWRMWVLKYSPFVLAIITPLYKYHCAHRCTF